MTRHCSLLISLTLALVFAGPAGAATFYGPTAPYLQASDSPFDGISFGYFHLDDLEDGALDTPGITANGGVVPPGSFTDSVDADDGVIDGDGTAGHSYLTATSSCCSTQYLIVDFAAASLPSLPTHVGFVFTNAFTPINLAIEVFDGGGASLGSMSYPGFAPAGGISTANAQFFGASDPAGISRIEFAYGGTSTSMEFDHFQYGSVVAVPVPAVGSLGQALLALGIAGLGGVACRHRVQV